MIVLTERLKLRLFRQSDLDAYAAMCADEEVMRHIGSGGAVARDVAWRHLAMFCGQWALLGHGTWALESREDGRLVGRAGFLEPEGWPGCELSWLLAREFWGRSLAYEACRAAIEVGRSELGRGELISLIRPDNARSVALALRLGATLDREIDFLGGTAALYRHAPAA